MNAIFVVDTKDKRSRCARRVEALPLEGEVWEIRIAPWEPKRSLEQNARLHLIFHRVAQATGNDLESVKLGYKAMFLPAQEVSVLGRRVTLYPKTSRMTKSELREFMDRCEEHAISEFGILLGEDQYVY